MRRRAGVLPSRPGSYIGLLKPYAPVDENMLQLKVGIQLGCLREPLKKSLETAARLGADAVEIDARTQLQPRELSQTGLRQIRKLLDDFGLKVCAVRFQTRRGYNVVDNLDRRIEATKDAMGMAYRLGAPVVVNQIGRVPAESQGPEWDLLVQAMTDLGRFGQHVGSLLAAKTGSEEGADLLRLLQAAPAGLIGVDFDPGALLINGFSAAAAIDDLAEHVLHVHARDAVRDLAQGRGLEVALGRGSVDFPQILGRLEEQGYRGYLTVERLQSDNPVAEVGLAVQYLKSL